MTTLPAVYLGHGAPPLLDDPVWPAQLASWAAALPRPDSILIVSAHWESAPVTLGATDGRTELVYDFYGFPERYYRIRYDAPGAPELAQTIAGLVPSGVVQQPGRGLDHGAFVPLSVMYPDADIPVLQMSLPTLRPDRLLELGRRLRPLRDAGVLIVGSGFLTHGLPFLSDWSPGATPPGWSVDFDLWAAEALGRGDIDELADFDRKAPGMPYAHPSTEHLAPLFVTLGAADDPTAAPDTVIDGYWMGLAKRSIQVA
jgi:4,5-DOPA dioxygenase extradiol